MAIFFLSLCMIVRVWRTTEDVCIDTREKIYINVCDFCVYTLTHTYIY